jgi:hypothetical protein
MGAGNERSLPAPIVMLGLAVAGLAALAAVWIAVTGWRARHDLIALRHDIAVLRADLVAGDVPAARRDLATAQHAAAAAHARTSGPAWWTAAKLPWLGTPLRTARGVAATVDQLSRAALPAVVAGGAALDPQQLRVGSDAVNLERLRLAAPSLARALQDVSVADRRIASLPTGWLGPVSSGRRVVLSELSSLQGTLSDTVTAAHLMPDMLGGEAPRRYLVVFEGDNEARGVGGILGGYGVLDAMSGKLSFERFGTDVDLEQISADVDLGQDFDTLYQAGDRAYDFVANGDLSPNFPYAAKIWSSMWEQRFGQPIDGVIAVDPTTMAAMLKVFGSVRLADGTLLTSANLVKTLEVGVYQRFGIDVAARKAFFVEVAQTVVQAMLDRSFSATALLRVLGAAAGEHRLVVYSAQSSEEAQLSTTPLSGLEPTTARPYAAVVVNNAAGTKLDYYLHRSVTYRRASCAAGPASVDVRLTNDAPPDGLPSYVTHGRSWDGVEHPPGTNELLVSLYGTQGSTVSGVTLDGRSQFIFNGEELGHPVTSLLVALFPGQTRTVSFEVAEPAATGPVLLPKQPLDQPMTVQVSGAHC